MVVSNINEVAEDTTSEDLPEPATTDDVLTGGALGAVGGAVVGALAGGPVGALVGVLVGGAASAATVDLVDQHDNDFDLPPTSGDPNSKDLRTPVAPVNTYTGADYRDKD